MAGIKMVFLATRPWSFPMTIISITFGSAISLRLEGLFNPLNYILALIGSVALHAAANVINDYYDAKYGVDRVGAPTVKYRPHPVIAGFMDPGSLVKMTIFLSLTSIIIAIYLAIVSGIYALILGLIGLILALTYTSPPLTYKYRALGELSVLMCWGPIMVLGAYYVQTSRLSLIPLTASLSIGLLVAAVLLANNIRDIEYDRTVGIKTIAIILGRSRAIKLYGLMVLTPYLIILLLVILGIFSYIMLIVFASLPKALSLIRMFRVEIPDTADPLTAQLVLLFGVLAIAGMLLPI